MRLIDQIYEVTGTLSPDVTGTYNPIGPWESKPSYEIVGTGWFIWWNGDADWYISSERGSPGVANWKRNDPAIAGVYAPGGTATGDATVSEVV